MPNEMLLARLRQNEAEYAKISGIDLEKKPDVVVPQVKKADAKKPDVKKAGKTNK
jgi:hypothetical protein